MEAATHADWVTRCGRFAAAGDDVAFERERANSTRCFDAAVRPEWSLMELELDVRLRPAQIGLAERLLRANAERGGPNVMQQVRKVALTNY